jgi:hypothetical protein
MDRKQIWCFRGNLYNQPPPKADMPTQADWNDYLVRFQELQEHPIVFAWTKR